MRSIWDYGPERRKAAFRSGRFSMDKDSVQAQSLIGWWPLGVHGGKAKDWDYSTRSNHGTRIGNMTRKVVNHPLFVGVHVLDFIAANNSHVDIINSLAGKHAFTNLSDAVTLEAWINPDVVSGIDTNNWRVKYTVVGLRNEGSDASVHVPFNFGINDQKIAIGASSSYVDEAEQEFANTTLSAGTWYRIAVTIDGDTVTFYLDGLNDGSATFSTATGDRSVGNNTANMQLGVRSRDGGQKDAEEYDGLMKDFRIYDGVQSSNLVNQSYRHPENLVYPLGVRTISFVPPDVGSTESWLAQRKKQSSPLLRM